MTTTADSLREARAIYDANSVQWSFHQAVDYAADHSDGDPDEVYGAMIDALKSAMPQVPTPEKNIVKWSKSVSKAEILALFDRALSAEAQS